MSRKPFLYLCLILSVVLSGLMAPLVQPSLGVGAVPNSPANISPSDGQPGISLTPTLVASAFFDSDNDTHFASQWQITTTAGDYAALVFDSAVDVSNLTITTVPAGILSYYTTYFWRVRYQDNNGLWSEYSTETSFATMANQPPATPTNVSPDGQTVSVTPTLMSSAFSDDPGDTHVATQWQIRLDTGDYLSPVFNSVTNDNSTVIAVPAATLSYSATYYWHVRYQDDSGAWSDNSTETWFLTSANQPPSEPVNSSPTGLGIGLTPTLASSTFFDPDGDTHAASQWQITTVSDNYTGGVYDSLTDNVNLTSIVVPVATLSYSTTYYWHVRYQDNSLGWSEWSTETSFTTLSTGAPVVATMAATDTTASSVTLNADLTSLGNAGTVNVYFQWGTDTSYGNITMAEPKTLTGTSSANLTAGLAENTTYHFRAVAAGDGTTFGDDRTFTTLANQPPDQPINSLPLNLAAAISLTPTLQSSIFADPDAGDTHAASQWQITTVSDNYTSAVYDSLTDNVNLTSIVVPVATLSYSTTYYWHVRYQDNRGAWSAWSAETAFNTLTPAPLVTTSSATSVTTYSAQLNGILTSLGAADNVTVSFVWGTSSGSLPNETTGQVMTGEWPFYFDLGSLTPGTTYCYQAKAVGDGTSYGAEIGFTTLPPTPLIMTGNPVGITTNSASVSGMLTSMGTASSVTVSIMWGTTSGSYTGETTGLVMTGTGEFSFDLGSLTPGTMYYYKARAVGDGTSYGVEIGFATNTTPPAVTTNDASNVSSNSGRLNGDLTSLGTVGSGTVSFVWGTSSGSLINETTAQAMTSTGAFYFDLDSLAPGTTYYYKAKAVGHGGPAYGVLKSFTTGQKNPAIENADPDSGKRKQHLTVTITGANLDGATNVSFGSEITVDDFNVVSSSEITAGITIGAKAAKGTRDVSVTTAWGTATKTDGFSVVGGGGGICGGGALATPGAPSEMTTVLAALGLLLGLGYILVRRGTRQRRMTVRA